MNRGVQRNRGGRGISSGVAATSGRLNNRNATSSNASENEVTQPNKVKMYLSLPMMQRRIGKGECDIIEAKVKKETQGKPSSAVAQAVNSALLRRYFEKVTEGQPQFVSEPIVRTAHIKGRPSGVTGLVSMRMLRDQLEDLIRPSKVSELQMPVFHYGEVPLQRMYFSGMNLLIESHPGSGLYISTEQFQEDRRDFLQWPENDEPLENAPGEELDESVLRIRQYAEKVRECELNSEGFEFDTNDAFSVNTIIERVSGSSEFRQKIFQSGALLYNRDDEEDFSEINLTASSIVCSMSSYRPVKSIEGLEAKQLVSVMYMYYPRLDEVYGRSRYTAEVPGLREALQLVAQLSFALTQSAIKVGELTFSQLKMDQNAPKTTGDCIIISLMEGLLVRLKMSQPIYFLIGANNLHPSFYNAYLICEYFADFMQEYVQQLQTLKSLQNNQNVNLSEWFKALMNLIEEFEVFIPFLHQTLGEYARGFSGHDYPVESTNVEKIEGLIERNSEYFQQFHKLREEHFQKQAKAAKNAKKYAKRKENEKKKKAEAKIAAANLVAQKAEAEAAEARREAALQADLIAQRAAQDLLRAAEAAAREAARAAENAEVMRLERERAVQYQQERAEKLESRKAEVAAARAGKAGTKGKGLLDEAKSQSAELLKRSLESFAAEVTHFHIHALPTDLRSATWAHLQIAMENDLVFAEILNPATGHVGLSSEDVDGCIRRIVAEVRDFLSSNNNQFNSHVDAVKVFCDSLEQDALSTRHNFHGQKGASSKLPTEYVLRRVRLLVSRGIIPVEAFAKEQRWIRGAGEEYTRYAVRQAIVNSIYLSPLKKQKKEKEIE